MQPWQLTVTGHSTGPTKGQSAASGIIIACKPGPSRVRLGLRIPVAGPPADTDIVLPD